MMTRSTPIRRILPLLVAAVLLAACTPTATPTSTPASTATPAATATTTATPTATVEPSATPAPTDTPIPTPTPTPVPEEHLGYVKKTGVVTSGGTSSLTINYVEIYGGAEAITKGAEDGVEVDGEYYIRDNNPALYTFEIASDCIIRLLDPSGGAEATVVTDVAGLKAFLSTVGYVKGALFEITTSGTTVVQILQFFVA